MHVSGLIPCPNSDRVLQDFYFIVISGVLFPSALILTLFANDFCQGEFRNGKKYAKLAYLLPISGISGVQNHG